MNQIPKCVGLKGVLEEEIEGKFQSNQAVKWYYQRDCPILEICPSCYHSLIIPFDLSHLFTVISRPLRTGVVRTCNFWIGTGSISSYEQADFPTTLQWRGHILRTALALGSESKDYYPFIHLAKRFQECGPPCGINIRGYRRQNGRKWFGRIAKDATNKNDCSLTMCEECFNCQVGESSLTKWLGNNITLAVYSRGVHNQMEVFCEPFSKKSKAMLQLAAEKNDFTIFARHWNWRA